MILNWWRLVMCSLQEIGGRLCRTPLYLLSAKRRWKGTGNPRNRPGGHHPGFRFGSLGAAMIHQIAKRWAKTVGTKQSELASAWPPGTGNAVSFARPRPPTRQQLLFDRGFIGFEDSGDLIVSPVAHRPSLQRMGVETQRVVNVGGFSEGQRAYLDFHRNAVLLRAVR